MSFRFWADEDFGHGIVRAVERQYPDLDVVYGRDVLPPRTADTNVLAYAAAQQRIVLSHDQNTMPDAVYTRLSKGLPMPGLFIIPQTAAIGRIVKDLLLVIGAGTPDEYQDIVTFFPL